MYLYPAITPRFDNYHDTTDTNSGWRFSFTENERKLWRYIYFVSFINVSLTKIIIAILGLLLICNDYWIFIIIIILLVNIHSFINVWFSYINIIAIIDQLLICNDYWKLIYFIILLVNIDVIYAGASLTYF